MVFKGFLLYYFPCVCMLEPRLPVFFFCMPVFFWCITHFLFLPKILFRVCFTCSQRNLDEGPWWRAQVVMTAGATGSRMALNYSVLESESVCKFKAETINALSQRHELESKERLARDCWSGVFVRVAMTPGWQCPWVLSPVYGVMQFSGLGNRLGRDSSVSLPSSLI